jgi:hypothetical protein
MGSTVGRKPGSHTLSQSGSDERVNFPTFVRSPRKERSQVTLGLRVRILLLAAQGLVVVFFLPMDTRSI